MSKYAERYSHEEIARAKGAAAAGVPSKLIVKATGIGLQSVMNWRSGKTCKDIPPDPHMSARILAALRGE